VRAAYLEVADRVLVASLCGSKCCVTSNIPADARIFAIERSYATPDTTKFFFESAELDEVPEGSFYPPFWAQHTSKDCHRQEDITFYSTTEEETDAIG